MLDDDQLVAWMQGIAAGDQASFNELSRAVRGVMMATIYKVLNNREDTEDVFQEVMLKVWERPTLFDHGRGRPLTWLRTLGRNRAIDRLRSKQRRSDLNERFRDETDSSTSRVSRVLSDEVATREHAGIVRDAVIELTEEQKQVLELAYFQGLTQAEIARRLDQPLGTVKARIRRGVKCLRERVGPVIAATP